MIIAPTISEANSPIAVVNQVKKKGASATMFNSAAIVIIEIENRIEKKKWSFRINPLKR